ncbi:MAG: polysaccharide deacetylase family protein [Treponema sp.]|nr:polysaccharide deacetylase family protein [Treponema sp.]
MRAQEYIIKLLISDEVICQSVWYGSLKTVPDNCSIVIVSSDFFEDGVYGTPRTLPKIPFPLLPNTDIPFLFGEPRLEKTTDGKIILYADLVASAYFLLSRYEEIIKPECRDQHGRFLAKDSIVFQQGYGMRPLVDEWGRYLKSLLRECGVDVPEEKKGFKKIYLTHDVDTPFFFWRKDQVIKQWVKNIIHYGTKVPNPLRMYLTAKNDPYYTFPKIIKYDNKLREKVGNDFVESIYFLITAPTNQNKTYCNIKLPKYKKMVKQLTDSEATLGLHVSYEGGTNTSLLKKEIARLPDCINKANLKSRHHFLRWQEPRMIDAMEEAGIKEDFTIGYPDSVGFRVGTCRPYYFINPQTKRVTDVLVHPMQIMECSLDRQYYMGLPFEKSLELCMFLIDVTYNNNGELVLLFHNPIWSSNHYYGPLYEQLLDYCMKKT